MMSLLSSFLLAFFFFFGLPSLSARSIVAPICPEQAYCTCACLNFFKTVKNILKKIKKIDPNCKFYIYTYKLLPVQSTKDFMTSVSFKCNIEPLHDILFSWFETFILNRIVLRLVINITI